jgi:hypothetical protein
MSMNSASPFFPIFQPEKGMKCHGASKREYFALICLHGLLTCTWDTDQSASLKKDPNKTKAMSKLALSMADTMLAMLEKVQDPA